MVPSVSVEHDATTLARRIPDWCEQLDGELWDLLKRALSHRALDRPTAATLLQHPFFRVECLLQEAEQRRKAKEAEEREEAERRQAALRMCLVCQGERDASEGLSCRNGNEPHFVCEECLAEHVVTCVSDQQQGLEKERKGVRCVAYGRCGCEQVYSEQGLAQHVSADVFETYFAVKSKLKEAEMSFELEKGFKQRLEEEVQLKLDSGEGKTCVLCLDAKSTAIVYPCGHFCLCGDCAVRVSEEGKCPMCRGSIIDIIYKVYS